MTAKQKAIAEAYGDAWNLLNSRMQQHILNVHHWVDRSKNRMNLSPKDLGFDEETECEVHCEFWRPKSLSGIEDNNGWTRIESESDLPKEKDLSYYWCDIRVKSRIEALKMILEPVSLKYLKQLHRADICTHWKKAEVQPSPIY